MKAQLWSISVPERFWELTHTVLHSQISIHPIWGPRVRGSRWKLSSRSERKGDPFLTPSLLFSRGLCTQDPKEEGRGGRGTKAPTVGEGTTLGYLRSQIYMEMPSAPLRGVPHKHSPQTQRTVWASGSPALAPRAANREEFLQALLLPQPGFTRTTALTSRSIWHGRRAASAAEVHPPSGSKNYKCTTCWLKANGEVWSQNSTNRQGNSSAEGHRWAQVGKVSGSHSSPLPRTLIFLRLWSRG